jgi:hypothetical protein
MSGASTKGGQGLPRLQFGVSTGGYWVEGGYNDTIGPANNWVWWERSGRIAPSGVARDFWASEAGLLDQAVDLGCDTFGLSVEWARIEPEDGVVDQSALDRYAEILDACTARGLEPVVSLHHGTNPWWLGEEYWLTPASPDRFAAHVATVVARLADHCRTWVTVVDPARLAYDGWVAGVCPPGRFVAMADAYAVLDNLLCAHVLAYREIHRAQPGAAVLLRCSRSAVYELGRLPVDLVTAGDVEVGVDDLVAARRRVHDAGNAGPTLVARASRIISEALSPYGGGAEAGVDTALGTAPGAGRSLVERVRRPVPRRLEAVLRDTAGTANGPGVLDGLWLGSGDKGHTRATTWKAEQLPEPTVPLYASGDAVQAREVLDAVREGVPIAGYFLELSTPARVGTRHRMKRTGLLAPAAAPAAQIAVYQRLIAEAREARPPSQN